MCWRQVHRVSLSIHHTTERTHKNNEVRVSAPLGRMEAGGLARVGMGRAARWTLRRGIPSSAGMGWCQRTQLPAAQFCLRRPQCEGREPDLSALLQPCFPAHPSIFHLPAPVWEGRIPESSLLRWHASTSVHLVTLSAFRCPLELHRFGGCH